MTINKLSFNEFKTIVEECSLKAVNLYSWFEDVAKYFYSKRNQEDICIIDSSYLDGRTSDIYEEFGITTNSLISYKNNFILYIEPDIGLRSQIAENLNNYPNDGVPTHLVVVTEEEEKVLETYEIIKEYFPGIICMQSLNAKSNSKSITDQICKTLGTDKVYDCFEVCNTIYELDRKSLSYLEEFSKCVDKVYSESKALIPIYSGDSDSVIVYYSLVAELYLRYGKSSYVPKYMVPYVIDNIMDSLFSKDTMLFEDLVNYFNSLPKLLIQETSYGNVYNIVKSKRMSVRLNYIDIESDNKNSARVEAISLNDLDLKSIYDFYNIDTIDGCERLKSKIMDLYKLLNLKKEIIDVTKLVIFSRDGKINIGYMDDLDMKVDVLCFHREIGLSSKTLDYNDLRVCVPPDIYIDGMSQSKIIFNKVLEMEFNPSYIKPSKPKRKLSEILSKSSIRRTENWSDTSLSLSTIGLYSKFTLMQRLGFLDNFIEVMGLDKVRKTIDCFGGFHPQLVPSITLGGH